MKKFSVPKVDASSGELQSQISAEKLEAMSEEEAEVVIDGLVDAAQNSPQGQGEEAKAKIDAVVADLNTGDGSKKEKLVAYQRAEEEKKLKSGT